MCNCVDVANAGGIALYAKNLPDFKRALRGHVRSYWNGVTDKSDFIFNFFNSLDRGMNRGFNIGVAQCGKKRDDLTDSDIDQITQRVNDQFSYIQSFADTIVQKKDKGKLKEQFSKLGGWFGRFGEMIQLGKAVACADQLLEWVLGVADHCRSCVKLNGIVKPASFWLERGILPRVPYASYLICGGHECKCELKPTKKPISRGRFPILP